VASDTAEQKVQDQSKAKVFISYSRKDMVFADRLDSALKARGFEPLIDRTDIYFFEEWWKRVQALIGQADTAVFVLSPDAVRPGTVALKEVAFAASLNKRFAPVVFRRVADKDVPDALAKLNFIFFDDASQFEKSADNLADALQTDIGWIRQHTEYGEAQRRWSAAGRPAGLLLHSPTLEVAEHWLVSRPRGAPPPTVEIQAFVTKSRNADTAAKRRRRIAQGLIYVLLIGIIAGLVGWINQAYLIDQWRWYAVQRPFLTANIWPYVLDLAAEQALKPKSTFRECSPEQARDYCPEMIVIPPGSFLMGSINTENGHDINESPQHPVGIVKPFAVSKFELTFDEWDTCVRYGDCAPGISDSGFGRGNQPVINLTLYDARQYIAWLSKITSKPYRLLTEAEYEYATRAGTQTAYPWGEELGENNANCKGCGSQWDYKQTAPVGSFAPNDFGLYDMDGNVFEWVEDCYFPNHDNAPSDGSARTTGDCSRYVVRGAAWNFSSVSVRSAARSRSASGSRASFIGFRVARTITR
jgi:formylglycine-generating enzyme required for sulfatase activity